MTFVFLDKGNEDAQLTWAPIEVSATYIFFFSLLRCLLIIMEGANMDIIIDFPSSGDCWLFGVGVKISRAGFAYSALWYSVLAFSDITFKIYSLSLVGIFHLPVQVKNVSFPKGESHSAFLGHVKTSNTST